MVFISYEQRQEAKRLNEEAAKLTGRPLYFNEGARKCPNCGELVIVSFDDSCGMVSSASAECEGCGRVTEYAIHWWIEWEFTGKSEDVTVPRVHDYSVGFAGSPAGEPVDR